MKIELQAGDTITIPEGCKAVIKDGNIVFKKEHKFKNGDILHSIDTDVIVIFKEMERGSSIYFYSHYNANCDTNGCWNSTAFRYATDVEKQLLFDKMKEQGLWWNAEEKRVEKIRWRAKYGEEYWYVTSSCSVAGDFMREENSLTGEGAIEDWAGYNHFRKKAQAAEAAKRVKETLRKYHEEIGE
jgi:hypothetical protein|nr:MAG TPA: hypothetical protein [Caudoviricetes sp.]